MPVRRGRWTAAAAAQARVVARMRERGHSLEDLKRGRPRGPARLRLHRGPLPRAPRSRSTVERGRRGDRARAGADRAHPRHPRHPAGPRARCSAPRTSQALRHCARVLAAGFPLVAFLQLVRVYVAVDAADRRRRGPPLPPLRARTADPRRRAGAGDGGGDGRAGRRHPAAGGAADRVPAHPLPALLPRAGRGRPHGERARRHGRNRSSATSRSPSASSTSPASPATPRRRATSRRSTWSRTSSRRSRRRCRPRRRS